MKPRDTRRPWSVRALIVVPFALTAAAAVMTLGPYAQLAEISAPSGGVLDEAPRSSAAAVSEHLIAIGEPGLALYREHAVWDVPFLIANAALIFVLIGFGLSRTRFPRALIRSALALPVLAAIGDVAENALVLGLVGGSTDTLSQSTVTTLAVATTLKMTAFSLGGLIAFASTGIAIVRSLRGRRHAAANRTTRRAVAA